ncbi:hypothetical protein ABWW58_06110, partial [Sporolactobacillus sp. STCC-11]|uniref:hypothetical protein n=1 Tax=Sporolactobacillus caesalpiniae TaxID=3230362 RepID=UPI003393A4F4
EDEFAKKGWTAVGDHGVTWDRSSSFESPEFWLPYFIQRVYTKDNPDKGLAFNILFDGLDEDRQIKYPILSCAVAERKDGKPLVKCNGIISAGWEKESYLLSDRYSKLYQTDYTDIKITNYFLSLAEITSEAKVRELVVEPLMKIYEWKLVEGFSIIDEESNCAKY